MIEPLVAGDEGRSQKLGERQIQRVVHCGIVPQFEGPRQQSHVGVSGQPEPREVFQSREGQGRRQQPTQNGSAQSMSDLGIQQMRRGKRLTRHR